MRIRYEKERPVAVGDIIKEMETAAPPVATMVMGVDSDAKDQVTRKLVEAISPIKFTLEATNWDLQRSITSRGAKCVIELDTEESMSHEKRHHTVQTLVEAGTASVIGVYVDHPDFPREAWPTADGLTKLFWLGGDET